MASLDDPAVRALLDAPNHAVLSSLNPDGSIRGAVVWFSLENGTMPTSTGWPAATWARTPSRAGRARSAAST